MSLTIRPAGPSDAGIVVEFNSKLAWETEHKRLDSAILTRGVQSVFNDSAKGFYLVSETDGQVVGQLMITY